MIELTVERNLKAVLPNARFSALARKFPLSGGLRTEKTLTTKLDPERTTKATAAIVGLRTVVIYEDPVVANTCAAVRTFR